MGHFLRAVQAVGFNGYGVEFDAEAASEASRLAGCPVVSTTAFGQNTDMAMFDVIHLGDVLEHLPNPCQTLKEILSRLKPGGLLFVEGPLETNPSLVYWSACLFGTIKHWLYPHYIGQGKPTHLFRVAEPQQRLFFERVAPNLKVLHWEVYETGWPYAQGSMVKKSIASAAKLLGGRKVGRITFGNRFSAIFHYS